jgi:ADP-ribosyl-[dinitrogen reductase] hydrolase
MERLERAQGSLVGLAIGDALGVTNQFLKPGKFPPVNDLIGGGSFAIQAGKWTDDTSAALCLAASLLEKGEFNPKDQLDRYIKWWRQGYMSCNKKCYDIGGTTSAALNRFLKTGAEYCGSDKPNTSGNASLVRLAPVVLYFLNNPEKTLARAADSSRTTHANIQCVDACRLLAALILGAFQGKSKQELLSPNFEPLAGYWNKNPLCTAIEHIRAGSYHKKDEKSLRGNGYVVHSLEAALWAFATTETFESGILKAVNLGEDSISTGAVLGQLAGAYYGLSAIPETWKNRLTQFHFIEGVAEKLLEHSTEAS